jgi:hypothetical protein
MLVQLPLKFLEEDSLLSTRKADGDFRSEFVFERHPVRWIEFPGDEFLDGRGDVPRLNRSMALGTEIVFEDDFGLSYVAKDETAYVFENLSRSNFHGLDLHEVSDGPY